MTDLTIITQDETSQNPALVYLAGLQSAGSRRVQKQALDTIASMLGADLLTFDWADLSYSYVQGIKTKLLEQYSHTTTNRMLSALRGVLKTAFLLGDMPAADYQKAIMVQNAKGENVPAGRELSPGEISALIAACESDPTPAGVRDAAIIAVLYVAGLRRAEIVDLSHYSPHDGKLVIRGKRNKERTVYLVNGAKHALDDWLNVRGSWSGPLFCPINKGGNLVQTGMTSQAIYKMLQKRAEQAGVDDFTPHDLRRTFVSDLLDAGADIATVAKMAGHANVNTTARYDRRPEQAKQKAANLLHVPYRGKS